MAITERQEKILEKIVKEYIHSALPVSSKLLWEKYNFGVSPATLRIEMQKLTDQGFLYQPHTSAGRIPTDKGYRFFVDSLCKKECSFFTEEKQSKILREIEREMENAVKLIQVASRVIADHSSNLGLTYLVEEDLLWKEGWRRVLSEPEFQGKEITLEFIKMIERFEKHIKEIVAQASGEPKVYIGKENPVFKSSDFSIITARFTCTELGCEGMFAILGPKRMNYNKNISLINLLTHSLQEN